MTERCPSGFEGAAVGVRALFQKRCKRIERITGASTGTASALRIQARIRHPQIAECGSMADAGAAIASQFPATHCARAVSRNDFLHMLGGDN